MRVLVSGGADRVGRAIALDLAEAGADVAISYHSSDVAATETVAPDPGPRAALRRPSCRCLTEPARWPAGGVGSQTLGGLDAYVHCPSGGFVPGGRGNRRAQWD